MIQPTKWNVPLGSGADVQELPNDDLKFASFLKIFPQITQVPLSAGGVAPRRIDFNSLFKLLADNIYFYQNGGVFEYSNTADYEKGALVRYNDKIYLCIQDNSALNVHNPDDIDYWSRFALNNELYDYVIESVVNSDGSWYRKWKSGWLEQGGNTGNIPGIGACYINLLVPFTNALYNVQATIKRNLESASPTQPVFVLRFSTTSFLIDYESSEITEPAIWYAYGMGA